ncbi:uncharacterized protein Amun isoform X1 [Hetaerina americana]|uniref:uncharacterized protein Amun isoform X1 n=2 Tax=Hetaerina americana TaxID=62018 RepID=UPI003A7F5C2F
MASVKDTATFFTKGTSSQFEHMLRLYPEALRVKAERKTKKPEELIKLDNWFQNELPKKIKSRGKDAHLVHEELVQLMKWKQARGKFYPQLSYLVKVNTPRAVITETRRAFRKLPNLEQAITALSNLKGVGTTMASALLSAAAPETAPFMADECLMAIPEIEGIDYTTKEYLNFVQLIQNVAERLNKEAGSSMWNPHQVELALWTHYVAAELKPALLDGIPSSTSPTENGNITHHSLDTKNGDKGEEDQSSDDSNLDANGKHMHHHTPDIDGSTDEEAVALPINAPGGHVDEDEDSCKEVIGVSSSVGLHGIEDSTNDSMPESSDNVIVGEVGESRNGALGSQDVEDDPPAKKIRVDD